MVSKLILFLKSILFGISNLIPGASGGTTLVICGIYDETLDSIANIRKTFKRSFIFLLILLLGTAVGVLGGGKLINDVLLKYIPFITICGFAGIIIGTIPSTVKPIIKKINFKYVLSFLISLGVIIGLMLLGYFFKNDSSKSYTDLEIVDYILLFLCGFIGIFAMIIPGVSGILIFLILGYYEPLLDAISNIVHIHSWLDIFMFAMPVAVGILVGIIPAAKIIRYLMNKFNVGSYYAIVGFVVGSIVCIFFSYFTHNQKNPDNLYPQLDAFRISLGVVALIGGAILSYFLARLKENKNSREMIDSEIDKINESYDNNDKEKNDME